MGLYLRMAWRNIMRHRRRSMIVFLAIGMSLAMMMWYDGIVAGFEQAIYANAIKVFGGNIQIHAQGYNEQEEDNPLLPIDNDQVILDAARSQPQVLSASRRINTSGIITTREGAFGVSIIGIEPEVEGTVSLLAQNVSGGRFLSPDDQDVIFIGRGLAEIMGVDVGDRISMAGRDINNQMRKRTMTVAGIYDLKMRDIEKNSAYISLKEAQNLFGLDGKATEIVLMLHRLGDEPPVIENLNATTPGYEISSWETNFPELKAAINTKGGVMNIFGVIIIMVSCIGILNILQMAVHERTREIGVLGALGMKPGNISILFLLEGGLMGVLGLVFGIVLGLIINLIFMKFGLDYSQFSGLTEYMALISGKIYPTLGVDQLLWRGITIVVISVLAAYFPAREAARHEPAQALHTV